MTCVRMTWDEFADKYCERQRQDKEGLGMILRDQNKKFQPIGWFLAECQMMGSSMLGSPVIYPYGPNNTFKTIPDHPFSPRGLASDQSVAIGFIFPTDLPGRMTLGQLQDLVQKRANQAHTLFNSLKNDKRKKSRDRLEAASRFVAACEVAVDILGMNISLDETEERIKALFLDTIC